MTATAKARTRWVTRRGVITSVDDIAARLEDLGLRPVIDRALDIVLSACPDCHAERRDPLGLWRPVTWTTTGRRLCAACGRGSRV